MYITSRKENAADRADEWGFRLAVGGMESATFMLKRNDVDRLTIAGQQKSRQHIPSRVIFCLDKYEFY